MICPKCGSKGFIKTKDAPTAVLTYGVKEKYATVDYRRKVCMMIGCGYRWKTKEVFDSDVESNQVEMDL